MTGRGCGRPGQTMLKFLVESPYERKLYRLGGDVVVIGRSRASDIPLLDERAKKRHAEVRRVGGGYRLVDLTDGLTRRNGEPAGSAICAWETGSGSAPRC